MAEVPPPPDHSGGGIPPNDPVAVLVLNLLLAGGAGYLVIGQKTKGILAIALWVALALPTCLTASFLVALAAGIDGYLQARQLRQGHRLGGWTFFSYHK